MEVPKPRSYLTKHRSFRRWLYQTKICINHIVYQENHQSIPPYFMALNIPQSYVRP